LALVWHRSRIKVDVLACLRAMAFNRLSDTGSKLPTSQHLLRAMDLLDERNDALGAR
jgi:hypothetical protein